jgi:hypothetical protein
MTETLHLKENNDHKREREEFATSLRKDKRAEEMKRRRKIPTSQPATGTIIEGTDFSTFSI